MLITKKDLLISLIISAGSLVVSLGVIGIKNLFLTALFFIIPLILTQVYFLIFKSNAPDSSYGKKSRH